MIKKIRNIAIGILVIVVIVGFVAFRYGYTKGFEDRSSSIENLTRALPGITIPAELQSSQVVYDMTAEVTLVLRGKLLEVSDLDRSIVIKAEDGDDSLTAYFTKGALMPQETGGWELDMAKVESHVGKNVTVVAKIGEGEKIDATTFFVGNVIVHLRK